MTAKHTPGPWRVDIDRAIVADSQARGIWRTVVADLGLPTSPNGAQEREANAHLIAAAPDLLLALVDLYAYVSEHVTTPDEKYHVVLNAATAIGKATGETK